MNRVTIRGLMGAVAGIAMVSGAQAADLPVKAKPVEYVKVCSAYGAGFYYIPGTDICLRVGGLVFAEFGVKAAAAAAQIRQDTPMGADHSYFNWRSRGHVILDARTNTAYGTLRSYADFGVSNTNNSASAAGALQRAGNTSAASMNRAFIEFAGFTLGYTVSFFDFATSGSPLARNVLPWQWVNLAAYTANLGNGVTATVSIEDNSHRTAISSAANFGAVIAAGAGYGGTWAPNVVGNINVRQAWGSAQVMGALVQVKPNVANQLIAGVDSDWGFAVGAGIVINTPSVAPGNNWLLQATYAEGATEFLGLAGGPGTSGGVIGHVNTNGIGPVYNLTDAHAAPGGLQLTEGWQIYTAYAHNWTPQLRSTFYAGYVEVDPAAVSNLPSLELWQAGIATSWRPVSGLDIGVDIMYSDIETGACAGALAAAFCNKSDGVWTAWTRITRSF